MAPPPPGDFVPLDGGFPTHADTQWGDPIAAALASSKSSSAPSTAPNSALGTDAGDRRAGGGSRREAERGQQQAGTGQNGTVRTRGSGGRRRNGGRRGGAAATATATPAATPAAPTPAPAAEASQDSVAPSELDFTLPSGGPGEPWCADDVEW